MIDFRGSRVGSGSRLTSPAPSVRRELRCDPRLDVRREEPCRPMDAEAEKEDDDREEAAAGGVAVRLDAC
jgi:hypothetical protein